MPDLKPLLAPDSVAIIGASADTHTLRGRTTQYLVAHGYPGHVYPVTRSQSEVLGLKAYPSPAALRQRLDDMCRRDQDHREIGRRRQCGR